MLISTYIFLFYFFAFVDSFINFIETLTKCLSLHKLYNRISLIQYPSTLQARLL